MGATAEIRSLLEAASLPEVLEEPVERRLRQVLENNPDALDSPAFAEGDAATFCRLLASSEFAAGVVSRDWSWFKAALASQLFGQSLSTAIPAEYLARSKETAQPEVEFKKALRRSRNRCLVHILWRCLSEKDNLWESLTALSDLADTMILAALRQVADVMAGRFGQPVSAAGRTIPMVVLAMGKLGGRELNFSSDIDLIFLYSEEGETTGSQVLSAHEYFTRYSRQVVNLLEEATADGFVYRVDTRLRPFGDSGPPVVSYAALENYLLQHGRSWERYAYIKARMLSISASEDDKRELQQNVIEPFVYRRYLDYGVFESLREMKALIEAEVKKRELADNIKLGPGGIREIEFIAQSLQLVRGGADATLRCRELKTALLGLGHARGLGRETVNELLDAYIFLRRLENAIQAIRDQQTHELPVDPLDRARLQLVMGFGSWDELLSELSRVRNRVSRQFEDVAFRGDNQANDATESRVSALWTRSAPAAEWHAYLENAGFENAEALAEQLVRFSADPALRQIDVTARKRLARFIEAFMQLLCDRRNPAAVCERVLAIVSRVVRRSAYVALLNENPAVLERLVVLCDQSAYLAGEIARYPLLLDELLDSRLYSAEISAAGMREDLDEHLSRLGTTDSESIIEALAHFQRAALFRIGVADVSGRLPIMKVSDRLTELAEIVLREALAIAWSDLVERHGEPTVKDDGGERKAGFGVIAYGKLGGMELSYGSDLDLVFLHDSVGTGQVTDGPRPLDNAMFFGRLVRRLVHFLTAQTPSGALYDVDTRLRPSGRSGLLVVNMEGFEMYQEDNAWTWEHQALLRSRPVAGSPAVQREFERIRAETLRNRVHRDSLLDDVLSMRARMRKQLDKSNEEVFDLKQGEGGIGDIEFLVQYLVLRHAGAEPALVHYSDNIRQLGALEATGILTALDVATLQDIYRGFRLRTHRLVLDGQPAVVAASEFHDERKQVVAIWKREMAD